MLGETITCACCGASKLILKARLNDPIGPRAYAAGWRLARGGWYCDARCAKADAPARP